MKWENWKISRPEGKYLSKVTDMTQGKTAGLTWLFALWRYRS
jgi:hypothetical protein